jgi:hypothetical protein
MANESDDHPATDTMDFETIYAQALNAPGIAELVTLYNQYLETLKAARLYSPMTLAQYSGNASTTSMLIGPAR